MENLFCGKTQYTFSHFKKQFILKTELLTLGIFVSLVKISEISIYCSFLFKPNQPYIIPDILLVSVKMYLKNDYHITWASK